MRYRLVYHPEIRHDIARLTRWFREYGNRETSKHRLDEVRLFLERLRDMPHRGSTRDDVIKGLRSIPVNRKTTITFVVDDDHGELLIYAISHAGQDWTRLARRRRFS